MLVQIDERIKLRLHGMYLAPLQYHIHLFGSFEEDMLTLLCYVTLAISRNHSDMIQSMFSARAPRTTLMSRDGYYFNTILLQRRKEALIETHHRDGTRLVIKLPISVILGLLLKTSPVKSASNPLIQI